MGVRATLQKVRAAIQAAAPDADESMSYEMPFYSYKGEVGIDRRLCYFRLRPASLRLYFRPKDLDPLREQVAKYRSTESTLHFPLDEPIPISLIQRIVRDAYRRHRTGTAK